MERGTQRAPSEGRPRSRILPELLTPGSRWWVLLPVLYAALLQTTSQLPASTSSSPASSATGELVSRMSQIPWRTFDLLHVPAFAILGGLLVLTLGAWHRSPLQRSLWALAIAAGVGLLGELSQRAVPGRRATSDDLVLDVAGTAVGILLFLALGRRWWGSRTGSGGRSVESSSGS